VAVNTLLGHKNRAFLSARKTHIPTAEALELELAFLDYFLKHAPPRRPAKRNTATRPTVANLAYGTHERQVLDFWKAKSGRPTPLVLYIHGGGWQAGDNGNLASGQPGPPGEGRESLPGGSAPQARRPAGR
jgi:acetyl esterase/lipase